MPFVLYAATTLLLLWVIARYVRRVSLAAACVLFALPLGLTGAALLRGDAYGPVDHLYRHEPLASLAPAYGIGPAHNASAIDVASEFLPWREAMRQSIRRGEWPLWNAYNLCGLPLAASAQAAPYLPFTWIACLLPAAESLTYTAAITLFVAAVSAFLFARELRLGESGSLFAAIAWALSASIVLYTQTAMGFTTALLPLLLAAVRRTVDRADFAAGAFLTTTLVLTILAGHPESLFLNVFVGCVYGVFELVRRRRDVRRVLIRAVTAGVAALLVSAIFLLPLVEAIPQSIEYEQKSGRTGAPVTSGAQVLAGIATNFFPHLHVRPWQSPPLSYIDVETAAVGSLVLALALYAVWRRRSPETWFFGALAVVGIIAGAGWMPLTAALKALPLMHITLTVRLAFTAALSLVILSALGLETLVQRRDARAAGVVCIALLLLLAGGMFWLSRNVVLGDPGYGRGRMTAELAFLALAAVVLFLRVPPRASATALVALLCAQRLISERDTFRTFPARAATPHVALLEPLRGIREPFRIAGFKTAFPPSTNILYGLEDVRGYEALTFAPFWHTFPAWSGPHGLWFNHVEELRAPFLSFMNVRFAIQRAGLPVPEGWRLVREANEAMLLENERVIERVFIPRRIAINAMTPAETTQRMGDARDFRDVAWIHTAEEPGVRDNGRGRVTPLSRSRRGEYTFRADMLEGGWVVVSDVAWKGWRATIDGRPAVIHRANAAFLGVFVPRGAHRVHLEYFPRSFIYGAAITLAALVGVVVAGTTRGLRRAGATGSASVPSCQHVQ